MTFVYVDYRANVGSIKRFVRLTTWKALIFVALGILFTSLSWTEISGNYSIPHKSLRGFPLPFITRQYIEEINYLFLIADILIWYFLANLVIWFVSEILPKVSKAKIILTLVIGVIAIVEGFIEFASALSSFALFGSSSPGIIFWFLWGPVFLFIKELDSYYAFVGFFLIGTVWWYFLATIISMLPRMFKKSSAHK